MLHYLIAREQFPIHIIAGDLILFIEEELQAHGTHHYPIKINYKGIPYHSRSFKKMDLADMVVFLMQRIGIDEDNEDDED